MPHRPNPLRCALPLALLVSIASFAVAQTQRHDATVRLPDIIGLRIVGPGSGPRSVTFDYAADADGYLAAFDGDDSLMPTSVNRFDDVEVHATRNGRWRITVQPTSFTYTRSAAPAGLNVADIRVDRSGSQDAIVGSGNSASYATTWARSTASTEIATRTGATGG